MSDRYAQLVRTPIGKIVAGNVGLPQPVPLDRYSPGAPVVAGTVLLGSGGGRGSDSRVVGEIARVLAGAEAEVATALGGEARSAAADAGLDAAVWSPETAGDEGSFKALVFDA